MRKKNKIFLFVLIAEIGFLFLWWVRIHYDIARVKRQVESVREEIRKLEQENEMLQERIQRVDEPFFLERMAREKLGLADKGEAVYRIVPASPPEKDNTPGE